MVKALFRRLLFCSFGKHVRSRGKAYEIEGDFKSECKYCGVAMHKVQNGKWASL